jgi:L-iditol 2-dehydrogenase
MSMRTSEGVTGKAAIFQGVGKPFSITRYPLPSHADSGLLVKVTMATICGSDLHRLIEPGGTAVPAIIGHESTGRISMLPEGVTTDFAGIKVETGDRIVYPYFKNCGRCHACLYRGTQMLQCENALRLSGGISSADSPHFNGAFAEYLYLRPGMSFFKVPEGLSDEVVTPLNCALSTVYQGIRKAGGIHYGDSVLIQGAGALGVYASVLSKEMGASKVIVLDMVDERLDFVKKFGADYTINIGEAKSIEERRNQVLKLTGNNGADVGIEVSGAPSAIPEGVGMLRKGARYIEIGTLSGEAKAQVDLFRIALKELQIIGNMAYDSWVIPETLEFLGRTQDRYQYKQIITHKFPLDKINDAFKVATGRQCVRVALVP